MFRRCAEMYQGKVKNKGQNRTGRWRIGCPVPSACDDRDVTDGQWTLRQALALLGLDGPSEPFVVAETPQENPGCQLGPDGEPSRYER